MTRQRPVLIAAAVLLVGGGAPAGVASDCGRSVSGQGFRVFACMSGGARAGHPHPKELLILRNDGSHVAYPAYGGQGLAVGDGEVVAIHDDRLVRVTSRRLVSLVTQNELSKALHKRTILVMGFGHLRVDVRGDVYFFASTLIRGRHGCQNRSLERLTGGTIRQLWSSSSPPNDICY